ncbi:unnamed protein product [Chilo suppressalis]|uniref:ATP-dependent DNA helicase n=1 Tax=Chilo suppressalis TaxID=168631 RepID=A0ABN8B399_CHISP|nr:unnamed protein product [Chilo suppressalis]
MNYIKAQDQLVNATRNLGNTSLESIIPSDINKTGGIPSKLRIFKVAKIMLRSNIDVEKGLVNGSIGFISDIVWLHLRRDQMYEIDIPSIIVNCGNDGDHLIQPIGIQFPAKFNYGTVERRMLLVILSWASTVHKMQGCTVDQWCTVLLRLASRMWP